MRQFIIFSSLAVCCIAGTTLLTCSNPVDKRISKPQLSIISDTTVSVKDSITLHVHSVTGGGKAVSYVWTLDSHFVSAAPTPDSMCRFFFGIKDTGVHIITVSALGQGNTESEPETTKVVVLYNPPVIHCAIRDTAIFANDSVLIIASAKDPNGSIIAYRWLIDTGNVAVFTTNCTLSCWFGAQAAIHWVRVSAMDNDSIMSAMDSVQVRVIVNPPRISVLHDTTVAINDTLLIYGIRLDTFSTTIRWVWAKDGSAFSDTTVTESLRLRFARNQAGNQRVLVKAIDSHRIESNVDSVHVRVLLEPPRVSIVHDTIVPINDPAVLHARGTDTNGYIARYVWALDGTHFADTTAADSLVHVYSRTDTGKRVMVLVKAIDDDTLESNIDSVHIVVHLKPSPFVTITHDTSVFINDTFVIAAKGTESGSRSPVTAYVWALDKTLFDDTTKTGLKALCFARTGFGRHVVRVKAVDRDTMESLEDSLVVQVRLGTPAVAAMKDTSVFINDTAFLHAAGTDTNGTVVRYAWAFDAAAAGPFTDTTLSGGLKKVWTKQGAGTHVVRVVGIDDDTISSSPALFNVQVRLGTPVVAAMKDTAVFINDTAYLHASGTDSNGTVMRYAWAFDGGPFTDTTLSGSLKKVWAKQAAGTHVIRVIGIDNDTISSNPALFNVRVQLGTPVVAAMKDTAVFINDTAYLHASGADSNGTVMRYAWAFDAAAAGPFTDTTIAGALKKAWQKQDTGSHRVRVVCIDNDTISSRPDSFLVRVRLGMPVIRAVHDTAVTWGTTVSAVISASDTNGTILKYLEDTTGTGTSWTDSSSQDTLRFTSSIHCRKAAIVGVRDDDGLVAKDTFFIDYRAVGCTVSAQGSKTGDTAYCVSKNHRQLGTPLSFSARRVDAVKDSFAYSLWSGVSPSALARSYQGPDTACTLSTPDSGTFYWKIVAVDIHNDTAETPVSALKVLLQRRICFIGHSIVTGAGGTYGLGGFRRMVIDTLRKYAGLSKKIWCEGQLTTTNMVPAQDDSCLAVGGKSCADIYDSLRIYSSTNADIWVYMNGANEGYRFPSRDNKYGITANYSTVTIDSMHGRNPQSEIYVLNGLPFPADTSACFPLYMDTIFSNHLPIFNQMLDTAITHRCQTWQSKGEAGVWLVDANTPMAMPPSGKYYNPAYFFDCLHPNQAGYTILARELFKKMRGANSSFLK